MYSEPFDKLIDKDTKMFLPTLYDVTFVSDMVCTAPGNVLFKRAFEIYLCKMR